jgi:hypothetical protein
MRLLFIENREKTLFWEEVAFYLERNGHSICWLVQNHAFCPKRSLRAQVIRLPYPPTRKMAVTNEESWVGKNHPSLITDRGRTYFRAGIGHYDHYKSRIEEALIQCEPDIVIGESTLFHELLTIHLCREMGIGYIQPMSNRYPRGRFSLLSFDSQNPILDSNDELPHQQALELAERIATSSEIPFYMIVPRGLAKLRQKLGWATARGRVLLGRMGGERYNTPSLACKLSLAQNVCRNLKRWHELERTPDCAKRTILYAMQLQPEANIDVWGRPYSDQVSFIKRLLCAAPQDFEIAIKINPKAKYELTDDLIAVAEAEKRICLLPTSLPMKEALDQTTGAITVSGTIGFEAMCGKGRALSLKHPIIEREFPAFHADTPEEAVRRLIDDPNAGVGSIDIGAKLIQRFVNQSFPGIVGDPISYPACMNPENVRAVAEALTRVRLKVE